MNQGVPIELFNREDIDYILSLLDTSSQEIREYVVTVSVVDVSQILEIDLEQIAMSTLGIANPVGQAIDAIKQWFQGVASWIVDQVRGLFEWFWNTFLKPAFDSLANLISGIVDKVRDIFSNIVSGLRSFISGLIESIKGLLSDLVSKVTAVLEEAQSVFGKIAELFGKIGDVLKEWATTLWCWIQEGLNKLGQTLGGLLQNIWQGIRNVWQILQNLGNQIVQLFNNVYQWIMQGVNQLWAWIQSGLQTLGQTLGSLLNNVWKSLQDIGSRILEFFGKIGAMIASITAQIGKILSEWMSRLWSWIQGGLSALGQTIQGLISKLWDALQNIGATITNIVNTITSRLTSLWQSIQGAMNQLWSWIQAGLQSLAKTLVPILNNVWGGIQKIFDVLSKIPQAISTILQQLGSLGRQILDWITKGIDRLRGFIQNIAQGIINVVQNLWNWLQQAIEGLTRNLGSWFQNVLQAVQKSFVDLASRFTTAFQQIGSLISKLWEGIQSIGRAISETISKFASTIQNTVAKIGDIITRQIQSLAQTLWSKIEPLIVTISQLGQRLWQGIQWVGQVVQQTIQTIVSRIEDVLRSISANLGNLVRQIQEGFNRFSQNIWRSIEQLGKTTQEAFSKVLQAVADIPRHVEQLARYVLKLGTIVTGGFSQLAKIIDTARQTFENVGNILKSFVEILTKPFEMLKSAIQGFVGSLEWIGRQIWQGLLTLGHVVVEGTRGLINAISSAIFSFAGWFFNTIVGGARSITSAIVSTVSSIFKSMFFDPLAQLGARLEAIWFEQIRGRKGELSLLFDVARQFLWEYYTATLAVYVLSGVVESLGNLEINIEPEVMGTEVGGVRLSFRMRDLVESFIKALKEFYPNFLLGAMFGLASTVLRPVEYLYRAKFVAVYDGRATEIFSDVLKEEIEQGALVSIFVEAPSITDLRDWLRRNIAVLGGLQVKEGKVVGLSKEIQSLVATYRAHLKLRGLPKWYIEYLTDLGQKLVVTFTDRFGRPRGVWLSEVFELPTHSELARMTQRDIFPSIYEMQKVAWTRGWNPDLTTMIYLLTFKYPSFEKLWQFYMRATAGMLWFSPPEHIRQVFTKEAEAIGAGVPVSPLEIQEKLTGPDQFKAFELAINTYFKWLEYSNFSWFTPNTRLYDIPVGQIIYGNLGGWTADSWIMADVAADIPTKIDMRWMSRYGIFLWMADRAEKAGVTFESYKPLVKALPRMLEGGAQSPIQVDLRWFSKLIQATGLHPAWVPIVTVAENIMVIADEMTLLRTGWLHLFKEGMLTVDKVETYLSGILTVSYQVGYWDIEKKQWTTAWINLPVRWLPHERRLLELRMLMDRIYDVYREFYSYIRSGIRTLALTAEEAKQKIKELIAVLDKHYNEIAKKITGVDMHLELDPGYVEIWIKAEEMARDIAAIERVRYWWYRVAGWLFYRIAYGYVTIEDIEKLIKAIGSVVPLHPKEVTAYRQIAEAILGIVRREYIPTPSQLASIAEYVPEAIKLVDRVLEARHVPEEWKPIWKKYVEVKPIANEVRSLVHYYMRAKVLGVDLGALEKEILSIVTGAGYTDRELRIIDLIIRIEQLIEATKEYIPTPSMLATIVEYVPEAVAKTKEVLEKRRVPKDWWGIWEKYIEVRPIANEVRSLLHYYMRAKATGVELGDLERRVLDILKSAGYTDRELSIVELAVRIEELIQSSREYIPTPAMLATMAEYVPEVTKFVTYVLEKRRVPKEWWSIWEKYIKARPLANEVRSLIRDYIRAKVVGVNLGDLEKKIVALAQSVGYTQEELDVISLQIQVEQLVESTRQYIPSPTTLATIAEYVPEAVKLLPEVLQRYRVPAEWRGIWEKYVKARALYNEVRTLISTYIRAKAQAVDLGDLEKKILDIVTTVGYTAEELNIIDLVIKLEEKIYTSREYIPTPSMLATIAEYVPEATKYIMYVLEKRRVPREWWNIWSKYVEIRPIADEVRSLVRYYIRAKALGLNLGDLEKQIIDVVTYAGYTEKELQVIDLVIKLEQMIEGSREYIPTPAMMATIVEYVPEAKKLIKDVLEKRRVPQEWRSIWEKYILVRPLADEVRMLLRYYMRAKVLGLNLGDLEKQILAVVQQVGYTDAELKVIQTAIAVEQLVEQSREYIPTPSMLASIAEYVPEATNLLPKVLEARRVPAEWRPIWEKYVLVRPIANEIRRLASAFYRLKRYADIYKVDIKKVEESVLSILKQYGYTDRELKILELAEKLEVEAYEIRELAREWVPTVAMLATLAEWIKIPPNLVAEVFEKRRIPQHWQVFWLKYLAIAPYRDDFRAFLREYFYFVVWGWVDKELEGIAVKLMELMNFDKFEQQIFIARAKMRRKRYAWREVRYWIRGTLRNLAYGVAHGRISMDAVNKFFEDLRRMGFTDEEINAMRLYFQSYVVAHQR